MSLRWFQTYDENGVDSEKVLQYWDDSLEVWIDVNLIRVPVKDEYWYDAKGDK